MAENIVALDGTLIVQAVNFLVFLVLINKFLFKPLLELLEEREREIGSVYSEAEALKVKAEELLKEVDEILSKAKEEAKRLIDSAVREAREEKEKIISRAQEEALAKIESAKREIWESFEREKEKLEKEAERIADEIIKKILGKAA